MIIQPESQISLFHSLVRIMYIMLNYVWKVLVLIISFISALCSPVR